MMRWTRRDLVYFILGGFFLTNALLGELTGGKLFVAPTINFGLFSFKGVILSIGVIMWPVVFITTDLINEYFGKAGVRKLTLLAVGMICYCFVVLFLAMQVPSAGISPVSTEAFQAVFGQSMWIIAGSLTAFAVSQLVDVFIFATFKSRTGKRYLWLRATGSTVVSQLIDSFIVCYIGFVVPGKITFEAALALSSANYVYKLGVAILVTPLIYLGHGIIDRFLGERHSEHSVAPVALAGLREEIETL